MASADYSNWLMRAIRIDHETSHTISFLLRIAWIIFVSSKNMHVIFLRLSKTAKIMIFFTSKNIKTPLQKCIYLIFLAIV